MCTRLFCICIGPHAGDMPWDYAIASVGKEVTGFSTEFDNADDNGEGEVTEFLIIQ